MTVLKELREVFEGKRNPHWFYLAIPSLAAALGLHAYLRTLDLAQVSLPSDYLPALIITAVPVVAFLLLFAALLVHFNPRAINTDYPIVIQNGEFKYEEELHIALRVQTLKNLVRSLVGRMKKEGDGKQVLFESGEFAGADFARKFPEIYLKELKQRRSEVDWDRLTLQEKLDLWRDWDKGVGWGVFQAFEEEDGELRVRNRHVSMYKDEGGDLLATMIAGYVVGVLQEIVGQKLRLMAEPTTASDRGSILLRVGRR